jgi:hypothetical protein
MVSASYYHTYINISHTYFQTLHPLKPEAWLKINILFLAMARESVYVMYGLGSVVLWFKIVKQCNYFNNNKYANTYFTEESSLLL